MATHDDGVPVYKLGNPAQRYRADELEMVARDGGGYLIRRRATKEIVGDSALPLDFIEIVDAAPLTDAVVGWWSRVKGQA